MTTVFARSWRVFGLRTVLALALSTGFAVGQTRMDRSGEVLAPQTGAPVAVESMILEAAEAGPAAALPMREEDFDDRVAAARQAADIAVGTRLGNGDALRKSVLVWLDPRVDQPVGRVAGASAARIGVRQFAAQRGLRLRYEYDILPNVINLRGLTQNDINDLAAQPGVTRVEEDRIFHVSLHDSIPLIRGLESQKSAAGLTARGSGARVCVIDTGINASHVLFTGRIDTAAGFDFFNGDSNPADDHGHGSNVSGIAVGGDGFSVNFGTCGSEPFQGVAPSATVIAVKVCSSGGSCPTSDIVAGINHCASTSLPNGQADVINLSLGGGQFTGTCDSDASAAAANNAVAAGVTVVAAAGNNGFSNALSSPACGSQVIPVGAVYDSNFPNCQDPDTSFSWCLNSFCTSTCTDSSPVNADERVCFSNRSVNLELAAPGALIWSAGISSSSSIIEMAGTSQASPHVAGLAALILGQNPSLTPAQVLQLMRDGAVDLGATGFDSDFGWGRIDVINTLNLLAPGCTTNADCGDGNVCNGAETCVGGTCQSGTPLNCNDGNACTTDTCNTTTGCSNTPLSCDDGNACTTDTCNVTTGCSNTPVNCDDANACTSDSCSGGTCFNDPITCNDGNLCTTDGCNTSTGCTFTPVICDDGSLCTTDSCNPSTGACTFTPVNCDDGNACTVDSCNTSTGCQHATVACGPADGCCPSGCSPGSDPDCSATVCGNRVCEGGGENCFTCPTDCRCSGRNCSNACCGDGICLNENVKNCPVDCGG